MRKRIILVSILILWAVAVVVVVYDNHRVVVARRQEQSSCRVFLDAAEQETALQTAAADKCQKWAAHAIVTGRWWEESEGSKAQKKGEPCDRLEFNRLKLKVVYQEQMLWLCKHPTKTLPQDPCLDADLKETCSLLKALNADR